MNATIAFKNYLSQTMLICVLAHNLTTTGFNYRRVVFGFGSSTNSSIDNANQITVCAVPVPATVFMFVPASFGLLSFRRRA